MRPFAFPGANANKFRNKKITVDGILFDSKKEAGIYQELKLLRASGELKEFERQVKFELIPSQKDEAGKVIERAVTYTADFVVSYPDGEVVVIDAKGNRALDAKYPIKRKMMLYFHKIRIKEI